jgi:Protein of unknown function (DUF1565)
MSPIGCATGCNNYYVSTMGSDSNSGTQASPWKTIGHAESALVLGANGTVVHVAPGTYHADLSLSRSGSSSAHITFASDSKYGAIVTTSGGGQVVTIAGNWNDFQNFEVIGDASASYGIIFYGTDSRAIGNKVHEINGNNPCTSSGAAGIDTQNSSARISAIGNVVYNVTYGTACNHNHGIYFASPGGIIENNIVYRSSAFGLNTWHGATQLVISNNVFFQNGKAVGGGLVGGGILIGCGDAGCTTGNNNTTVDNNIIYDNPGIGLRELGTVGSSNIYRNNLMNSNGADFSFQAGSCVGCINVNPQFVNYQASGSGDYHLASGSLGVCPRKTILLEG